MHSQTFNRLSLAASIVGSVYCVVLANIEVRDNYNCQLVQWRVETGHMEIGDGVTGETNPHLSHNKGEHGECAERIFNKNLTLTT